MKKNKQIKELEEKLNIANGIVAKQIDKILELENANASLNSFIVTQENQLRIADKAIARKDKQFLGLRSAYQDEIINKE